MSTSGMHRRPFEGRHLVLFTFELRRRSYTVMPELIQNIASLLIVGTACFGIL